MIFGLRFDCRNPGFARVDMGDRYRALLDMCEWADQRGALFVGLSEHHGAADDYLPSPLVMAAAIAARTSNVRIGIHAIIAPFYDPLRLAEDAAVVDLLSGGRLDLTIAGGYVQDEFEMFGRQGDVVILAEDPDAAWRGLGPYFLHETNAYGPGRQPRTSRRHTSRRRISTSFAPPVVTAS